MKERRRHPRSLQYRCESMRIEPGFGGEIDGQLVDVSEGGLGVELFVPLILDSVVSVSADLEQSGERSALQARARVVHCFCTEEEMYRVGLAFEDVHRRDLGWAHN